MRNKKIWLALCICGLFLGGCGNKQTPQQSGTKSGVTLASSKKKAKSGVASPSSKKKTKSGTASSSKKKITKEEALAKALKHANVKKSSLKAKRIKKDVEDGSAVYDIEFYANGREYDYKIRISDGRILKYDYEVENDSSGQGTSQNKGGITKAQAKKIALSKVPGAKRIRIKKDREDGKIVYEGEIHYKRTEYEFEIDASTGKILSWEIDND